MADITEREIEAIHDTHDKVIRIETILGDGDAGLLHEVKDQGKKIRRVEIIIASLVGSGILGGGALGIMQLVSG